MLTFASGWELGKGLTHGPSDSEPLESYWADHPHAVDLLFLYIRSNRHSVNGEQVAIYNTFSSYYVLKRDRWLNSPS